MSAYPAGGAFYGTHAEQYDNVYSNDDLAGKGNYDADAWGTTPGTMSASSSGDARDRWLARKEAAAATMGEKGEYTYGKGAGAAPRKNRIWLWTGLIVGAVIIAAVVVGVVIALKNKNSTPSSKPAGVVKSDPKDPSNFDKDPNLHNSFYGMCYTPLNAQYPACGDTQAAVTEDIQLISQLTDRIRLYGADCNMSQLVLQAIQETKTNMTVFLAVYVDDNSTTYQRQVDEVQKAIQAYGVDHVSGVTVGNEWLLNGGTEADLISKMADMRTLLKGMNLPKTIPVGTADAGSKITSTLSAGADYIMANVHPWFGGVPVDQSAGWTWDYFQTNDVSATEAASNKPAAYIAETGWPTGANDTANMQYQAAVAGVDQLNTFLDTFVCAANQNNTNYFYFEAFDEPWKEIYGGVETHWGLFNANKTLKAGVKIPDCPHS